MNSNSEFETVRLLQRSNAETRGVDAFALSVIKAERQIRRLFTFCVFQFPCFGANDVSGLRETLGRERVYFEGFEKGLTCLLPWTIADLIGLKYGTLRAKVQEATLYRNKIFHGQLTADYLSREELFELVDDIWVWCTALASNASAKIGYDGFARESFQKSKIPGLSEIFSVQLKGMNDYAKFIHENMLRQ